jgi:hypothetical protein
LSVTGRLITSGAARRYGMSTMTAIIFAIQGIGVLVLPHVGPHAGAAAACIIAFGLGFGVATIARPAIVAERHGVARYATIAATMAMPITLAKALAPLAGAAATPTVFLTVAGLTCLGSAAVLWHARESPVVQGQDERPSGFAATMPSTVRAEPG